MDKNKLLIATAGAGKTTYLVNQALDIVNKSPSDKVLITTYTRENARQIREKIIEENTRRNGNGLLLKNIIVQEWFSFLLKEGVRPFKSVMDRSLKYKNISLYHDFQYNNNIYISESQIRKHYFLGYKIIPNCLSKFIVKANVRADGEFFCRLSRMYSHVFIDEVQDLAGYDLEIIKELFISNITVILVGDPRQVTYLTHHERLNSKYKNGKIKDFVLEKCKKLKVNIDEETLKVSHRNNGEICEFSSKLYPGFEKAVPCSCVDCRDVEDGEHVGIFTVRPVDVDFYIEKYGASGLCVLRKQKSIPPERNFGESKGMTFNRVLICPDKPIIAYLKTGNLIKMEKDKKGVLVEKNALDIPKFYVAITRARYSVAIVYDYQDAEIFINGVQKYDTLLRLPGLF